MELGPFLGKLQHTFTEGPHPAIELFVKPGFVTGLKIACFIQAIGFFFGVPV